MNERTTAPDKIYIDRGPNGGWMHRHKRMSDTLVEYTRSDLIPNAAYVAGLEAALIAANGYLDRGLDKMAFNVTRAALSARPDAPDLRVVPAVVLVEIAIPIEAMLISGQNSMSDEMFMAFQKSADCIRAIIGGMK